MYKLAQYPHGGRFQAWRETAKLTQKAAAKELGVEQQTISDWERGESQPHISRAPEIDRVYGLPEGTVGDVLQGRTKRVGAGEKRTAAGDVTDLSDAELADQIARLANELNRRQASGKPSEER